jgi:hypothetical protein
MAEALTNCGLALTEAEQLPQVLPSVDPELGALSAPSSNATTSTSYATPT